MGDPVARIPIVILQGAEFRKPYRWMQPTRIYKAITGVQVPVAPPIVEAAAHGLPEGWPFWIESVKGMTELNRTFPAPVDGICVCTAPENRPYRAKVVDVDHVELNDVNALDFAAYTSSGVIIYQLSYDLAGATARMQIRDTLGNLILELTTENGGIIIDQVKKTINLFIADDNPIILGASGTLPVEMKYDLEVVLAGSGAKRVAYGPVKVDYEVTHG